MITRLHLKRWKSHEDTELRFTKGTNLFIGKMGSGKSSVMDAISFGLFGTFPALKSRKVKIEELVMQRPRPHSTAEVELEFELGRKKYKVVRHAGIKATSAQLFEEGKLIEAQTSRVSELVESILKIDYDLFSRIIYAEQNRIDYLLTLPKGERKKQIDELLGISRFEEVRQNSGTAINQLQAEKSEAQRFLDGTGPEELRKEKAAVEEDAKNSQEKRHQLQHGLSETNARLREAAKRLAEYEKAESEHAWMQREMASVEALISEKNRELKEGGAVKKEGVTGLRREITLLEKEMTEKNASLQAHTAECADMGARLGLGKRELAKLKAREDEKKALLQRIVVIGSSEKLEGDRKKIEEKAREASTRLAKLQAEAQELKKSSAALKGTDAKCPTCDADLDAKRKAELLENKLKALGLLEPEMHALTQEISSDGKMLAEASGKIDDARRIELKLKEMEGSVIEKETLLSEIARLEKLELDVRGKRDAEAASLRQLQDTLSKLNSEVLKAERSARLDGEIRELEGRKAQLQTKAGKIRHRPEELQKERQAVLEAEKETSKLLSEIGSVSEMLALKQRKLSELEAKLTLIVKHEGLILELGGKIEKMAGFREALIETQATMREELIEAMNAAMETIWQSTYPYKDYSRMRLLATEDDYALELRAIRDEWVPLDTCSGGEKSCAALTLRVAFAMVLTPNLSWLILDEPTHNLDAQAVQMLNRALHDELPRIVEQTFIITHDEALKEGASAKIFYFERDKDNSDRTVVEEVSSGY